MLVSSFLPISGRRSVTRVPLMSSKRRLSSATPRTSARCTVASGICISWVPLLACPAVFPWTLLDKPAVAPKRGSFPLSARALIRTLYPYPSLRSIARNSIDQYSSFNRAPLGPRVGRSCRFSRSDGHAVKRRRYFEPIFNELAQRLDRPNSAVCGLASLDSLMHVGESLRDSLPVSERPAYRDGACNFESASP